MRWLLVSQVQTTYDNSFSFYPDSVSGGTYGQVTQKTEYGYGVNNPGSLLRKTVYTNAALSGNAYLVANLLDLVVTKTVYDGNGVLAEQTSYGYDGQRFKVLR